tara:strand:- start:761 stop:1516 length:756 start_codon:yes stop_codon:yes gene_type:complete
MARRFGGSFRRVAPQSAIGGAGQGRMGSIYSGARQFVRHSVDVSGYYGSTVADAKAEAYPLIYYGGLSGNVSATPDRSSSATIREGSRVNHVQVQLQITQSDPTKPNNCYIGFIQTSFSDAQLNAANMTKNFNDLIAVDPTTGASDGIMLANNGAKDMTIKDYMEEPSQRHWIRGLAKNQYTLYSGRPAILDAVLPVPPKCKRGQFGMGWWIVIMNDSSDLQGEVEGSATDINISLKTFFKEIQDITPTVD